MSCYNNRKPCTSYNLYNPCTSYNLYDPCNGYNLNNICNPPSPEPYNITIYHPTLPEPEVKIVYKEKIVHIKDEPVVMPEKKIENEIKEVDELLCPVCLDSNKNSVLKTCGHTYCYKCLKELLKLKQKNCPTCKKEFELSDIIQMYL